MKLARAVERRLERMLDGMAGRVFTGNLHPTEIASRIVREADLESTQHPTGPMVPNVVIVSLHPDDLSLPPASLARILTEAYEAHSAEEGWRLPGPTAAEIRLDPSVPPGTVSCRFDVRKGQRRSWGRLSGPLTLELANNRLWLGRSDECDVVVPFEEVSRHHALLVREQGSVWVTDLGSANGTLINGLPVGEEEPVEFVPGSTITLADRSFRLEIA